MGAMSTMTVVEPAAILLRPRPFASSSGTFLLLPLLPHRIPARPLPTEIWIHIFEYVFAEYDQQVRSSLVCSRRLSLLLICKTLKDIALPLYYSHIHLTSISAFQKFTDLLYDADQRWDSIRRIPYSAPGRWVQVLDLSDMSVGLWADAFQFDTLLTKLFPVVPFLSTFLLNATTTFSRRAIDSLCYRDGTQNLRSLKGVKLSSTPPSDVDIDPFLEVLRCCRYLEEFTAVGSGIEAIQLSNSSGLTAVTKVPEHFKPLVLPRLRQLALVSMHTSPVMFALLHSPLPSLAHLTITPYDDISISTSLVPVFIQTHGSKLTSLHLYAHKSWPTILFPSPTTLLHTCPKLYHLSLENPLPQLSICSIYPRHPLRILSIPRPNSDFLAVLEALLPKLSSLSIVRARDVRWLRSGMTSRAQEAGVQGEMRDWSRRLGRRGIQVLDADWKSVVE